MASIGTISGIASSIPWRDLVDQIIAAEEARLVTPIETSIAQATARSNAWTSYQTVSTKLGDAIKAMGAGAVDALMATVSANSTGRTLFNAAPATSGTPGTYQVEVVGLASSHKLSGSTVASPSTALGIAGTVHVNGRTVTISATHTLAQVRDAFNAANTGLNRSGVSATILSVGGTGHRLVLSSDGTGRAGIELGESAGTALSSLGLVDTGRVANTTLAGDETRSAGFTSSETAIGTLLGLSSPPAASTLVVGNRTISVDLALDSLDDIAEKLTTAGITASVATESRPAGTRSVLTIGGIVSGDLDDADTARTLELLGVIRPTYDSVAQVVQGESPLEDALGDPATASTLLVDLESNGSSLGIVNGDTIRWRGTEPDGTVFTIEVAVTGATTLGDLRTAAQAAYGADATVTVEADGTLQIVDAEGGESRLGAVLSIVKSDDSIVDFGRMATTTVGYSRQITAGADAHVRIDGVDVLRSTNSITDVLDGGSITLVSAEPGVISELRISRDTSAAITTVGKVVAAYNEAATFVKNATAENGAMAFDTMLRGSLRSINQRLQETVSGLSGVTRAGQVGLSFDRNGVLTLDSAVLKEALVDDLPAVRALFGNTISAPTGVTYLSHTDRTASKTFALNITAAATVPSVTGAGFSGSYLDSGVPDTLQVTDSETLETVSIDLVTGDDIDAIIEKLNDAFEADDLPMLASSSGGQLVIAGTNVGSASKFNLTLSGAGDPATQLGIATAQYVGTDVVGTFDGVAGVGVGTRLTGAEDTEAEGLEVRHTSAVPVNGSLVHILGLGDLVGRLTTAITRPNDGLVARQTESLSNRVDSLERRADTMRDRIERRRELLIMQFTRMEQAMAILQSQTSALTNQIAALQSTKK